VVSPSLGFTPDLVNTVNPAIDALPGEDIQFYLCNTQPTAMFGNIGKFETIQQSPGFDQSLDSSQRSSSVYHFHLQFSGDENG